MPFADIILKDNGTATFDITLSTSPDIEPVGIVSAAAFGTPNVANDEFIDTTAIDSAETFGTHQVSVDVIITVTTSISSLENVSSGLGVAGNVTIMAQGVTPKRGFGTPQLIYDVALTPASIDTDEAFGIPHVIESTEAYLAQQRTANRRPKFPGYLQQGIYMRRYDRKIVLPVLGPEIDSYYLTSSWFGQPKSFSDNTAFHDISNFSAVGYLNDVNNVEYFPSILGNVNLVDPFQMDGVIEPLTIRSAIAGTSIDVPFEAKSTWGSIEEGNIDYTRRSDRIFQYYDVKIPSIVSPFIDSGEYFGTHLTGSVILPGEFSSNRKIIRPFSDTDKSAVYDITASINSADIANAIRAMLSSQDEFLPRDVRSSGAGFTYDNTPMGTDSLAFGGLKR